MYRLKINYVLILLLALFTSGNSTFAQIRKSGTKSKVSHVKKSAKSGTYKSTSGHTSLCGDTFKKIRKKGNLNQNLLIPTNVKSNSLYLAEVNYAIASALCGAIREYGINPSPLDNIELVTEQIDKLLAKEQADMDQMAIEDGEEPGSWGYSLDTGIAIFPTTVNDQWIEFCVSTYQSNGGSSDFPQLKYIALLRNGGINMFSKALALNCVLSGCDAPIINLIRESFIKEYPESSWAQQSISKVSDIFSIGRNGITFYYNSDDLTLGCHVKVGLFVPYSKLKPYLNKDFAAYLAKAKQWQTFKELSPYLN